MCLLGHAKGMNTYILLLKGLYSIFSVQKVYRLYLVTKKNTNFTFNRFPVMFYFTVLEYMIGRLMAKQENT